MKERDKAKIAELAGGVAAGNGLLDRRSLLRAGVLAAGIAGIGAGFAQAAETIGADAPEWMKTPGRSFSPYGMPSKWQEKVQRSFTLLPGRPWTGTSRTPLHLLEGTLTPNGLHFERHHNGVPDIDPNRHELVIHGDRWPFPLKRSCAIPWSRKFTSSSAQAIADRSISGSRNRPRQGASMVFYPVLNGRAFG